MSSRRLPAAVYWRRRLLLVALLIALVWTALQLWPDGADETSPTASRATPDASATASPEPSTSPSPSASPSAKDGAQPTTVRLASADAACDPQEVRVTPSVPPGQSAGAPVDIDLVISSTAAEPCTFRADQAELLVVISAGDTAVWDSTVCRTALLEDAVVVSPGWATVATATWSGRGSGVGCSDDEGWVGPGTYSIKIGSLGGEPGETGFRLEEKKPEPKPEPTASTAPSPSPEAEEGE